MSSKTGSLGRSSGLSRSSGSVSQPRSNHTSASLQADARDLALNNTGSEPEVAPLESLLPTSQLNTGWRDGGKADPSGASRLVHQSDPKRRAQFSQRKRRPLPSLQVPTRLQPSRHGRKGEPIWAEIAPLSVRMLIFMCFGSD